MEFSLEFSKNVKKAINLIGTQKESIADEEFFHLLIENIIPNKEAIEILIFLPVVFCRQLFPQLKWLDTYFELFNDKERIEKKYSETKSYGIIWQVVAEYFSNKPDQDIVLKIAGRSSEFHAVNQFLNNGGKLKDIEFSPTIFFR